MAIDAAQALKLDEESSKAVDKKGRPSQVTFPFRRAILGFLSAVVCWGIPYLFLDHASAGSDPLARFKPLHGHAVDSNGMQMYYALENADVTAERRNNAMIYGAGVGVTVSALGFSVHTSTPDCFLLRPLSCLVQRLLSLRCVRLWTLQQGQLASSLYSVQVHHWQRVSFPWHG